MGEPKIIAIFCHSRRGFGNYCFLAPVLVALWFVCYCSLRTFSDLALVFFVISLVSFCWTEDASMTRNRFPSKAMRSDSAASPLWCLDAEE